MSEVPNESPHPMPGERLGLSSAEYAIRVIAAPVAAVIAGGAAAVVCTLMSLPLGRFDSTVLYYASAALDSFGRGFAFVFAASFVLPGRWRVGGAVVFVPLGIALQMYLMSLNTSDPEPPLWPLFVEIAGGLAAAAVQYFRRPRNES